MKPIRLSLRVRFLLASFAPVVVVCATFAVTVSVRDAILLGTVGVGLASLVGWVLASALDGYEKRLDRVREREQAFTEDASHELRTPLAIISSASELLLEESALSAGGRERLLRIRRASGQMHSLIEALLFLARGEPGTPAQPCALDQIVRDAAESIAAAAAVKSLEVIVEVEPVTVVGVVPAMAACVVNNLLLNAVNFTQTGRIAVSLTATDLLVRDTGIGISPEDLSRIFERLYRGDHSRGSGLGLYLVSRICERLGWRIEAHSEPGSGTTFRIRLDRAAAALPPVPEPWFDNLKRT